MTKETRQFKTYETQQKQFSEGSLQQYNPTSRNKKKSQINNVTLHLKQLEAEAVKGSLGLGLGLGLGYRLGYGFGEGFGDRKSVV